MPRRFSSQWLFRLRNEVPLDRLIAEHLAWPSRYREGRFHFLCPRCGEFRTGVNPRTNLGRCFLCAENFNSIDFVILARECDFVDAVHFLAPLLPKQPASTPAETQHPK